MLILYFFYLPSIFVFSILINAILLRLSSTLGIRNSPEQIIRWSPTSKPSLGGISFFIIFLFSYLFQGIIFENVHSALVDIKAIGVLCTATLAFLMGLADDAFDTKPWIKFFTQIACGLILISTGTQIHCFENAYLNYAVTMIWVIGLMNAINLLDNMDAISTIVCMVILGFFVYERLIISHESNIQSFLCVSTIGALAGFLFFNWHPAKMFMGDTGSQFLGVFLAILGIEYCWNLPLNLNSTVYFPLKNILITTIIFILPITDITTVCINRMAKKKSPFIGGKDHTTHHLFFKGITEKRIAILFAAVGIISCCVAHNLYAVNSKNISDYLLYLLFSIAIFLFFFLNTRIKKKTK